MSRKFIQILFSVLLLGGMILGFAIKDGVLAQAPQTDASVKIEGMLLDKFTTDGNADFIISFTEKADLSAAFGMDWETRGHFVYDTLTAFAERLQAQAKSTLDGFGLTYHTFFSANELYVFGGNLEAANALATLPQVSYIRATRVYQVDPVQTSSSALLTSVWVGDLLANHGETTVAAPASFDWGITDTAADQFWGAYGVEGAGVVVANIDTGVDYTHIALSASYKCAANPSDPSCWEDPTNNCPGGLPCDAWPGVYHGTHTMGTMVGSNDPSLQYQVGMAPAAEWIACLGCPSGGCPDINLNTCGDWIVAPGGNPDNRPNVVNNSWGGGGGNPWYLPYVQSWVAAGVFPAFSAGNSYSCSSLGSPGDYQESFASAAHDSNRNIAGFSSKGPSAFGDDPYTKPNISAPGVDVMSAMPGNGWQLMSGTSMASPHSAGAVALLWSCNPSLVGQIDQTFQILQDNTDAAPAGTCGAPADGQGNYTFGYGYLNVFNAGALWCGETGTLDGHVYDAASTAPIAGAAVHAVGQYGGGPTAITDNNGYYNMSATVGSYDVTASHPHYLAETIPNVVVVTDTVTTQDFDLVPRGFAYGYVRDFDNNTPLQGATVEAEDGSTTTTDASGYYELWLDPGIHDLTASLLNYAPETATVTIVSGGSVQQDFALMAAVVFTPSPIEVSVPLGSTFSQAATILNRLPTDYAFEFKEKDGGYVPSGNVSIPAFTGTIEHSDSHIGLAPGAHPSLGGSVAQTIETLTGAPAFAENLWTTSLVSFTSDNPGAFTTIASEPGTAWFAGDFVGGDFSTLFVLDYNTNSLYSVDTTTGATTLIGSSIPGGGESWTGMTGSSDGTMYASATTCGSSTLYTVDLGTGGLTTVGPITNGSCVIDIAITPDGEMYGVDIVNDNLISIDPNTGAGTTIGSIGFDANYAQGMDYEEDSGTLYLAAFNNSSFQGELRIADVTTGNTTLVGAFDGNAETDAMAFATGGAADVPWLSEVPPAGVVPAESSLNVSINFDASPAAGVTQPGNYLATLTVLGVPKVSVPVAMFVEAPASWGRIEGTVTGLGYCDQDPMPLKDATVVITGESGQSWTLTTDAAGHWAIWLDSAENPLTVAVTFPDYLGQSTTANIIPEGNVVVDFDLRWDKPCMTSSPATMSATLNMGETSVQPMTLSNTGAGTGTFEMSDLQNGYTPMRQGFLPRGTSVTGTPASLGRAPNAPTATPAQLNNMFTTLTGEPAFAMDVYPGYNFVTFTNDNPSAWTIIAGEPSSAFFGGDFLGGDFSKLYVVDYYANTLYTLDTTTGAKTTIGPMFPSGGETWTGMSGSADGTMFASASACGSNSSLYTVDVSTGAATLVGSIGSGTCIIDIASTPDGSMFAVDIVSDVLLSIDTSTGAGTVIGPLGFDANYAQGMDFEDTSGTLYLAAFNLATFQGELRIADPGTGNTVLVGTFPGGAEVDALGFATGGSSDAPWLSENPTTGTVPPDNGSQIINVTFDAGMVTQPGTYTGQVKAKTNDPVVKNYTVDATLTVIAPPDWGKLNGTVTDLGYCDVNQVPLKDALVSIEGGLSLKTDVNGFFELWLAQGTYNVTVTKDGHTIGTATVVVTGGLTTTQDFDLRLLQPCMTEDPASLEVTLDLGQTISQSITLGNTGAAEGTFEVKDADKGYTPKTAQKPPLPLGAPIVQIGSSNNARIQPLQPRINENTILEITTTNTGQSVERALNELGYGFDIFYGTPWTGIDFTPYDTVIVSMDGGGPEVADIQKLRTDVIDEGKKLILIGGTCYQPFAQGVNDYLVQNNTSDYCWMQTNPPQWTLTDSGNPLAEGLPDSYNFANLAAGYYSIRVTDPEIEQVAINGEGHPSFFRKSTDGTFLWFIDSPYDSYWADSNDFAFLKQLIQNTLEATGGGDALWLSENPLTGTVAPDTGSQVIDVGFHAELVTQPGTYNAQITIKTNDPVNTKFTVPVIMNVNGPPDWGRVEGVVTTMGYCDQNPAPLEGATVVVDGVLTLTTDANGHYSTWIASGTHELVVTADGNLPASATVVIVPQEVTTQDFSLRAVQPCTSVNPTALVVDVAEGYTLTTPLSLINSGAAASDFRVLEMAAGLMGFTPKQNGIIHTVNSVKTEQPAGAGVGPNASGGPDPFGYTFMDSNEPGGPSYDWIEIATPAGGDGTALFMTGIDDGWYFPVNLANPFNFYGTDYTQIAVESNGAIAFENGYVPFYNGPIPGDPGSGITRFIAQMWDDLYIVPGDVYYRIDADKTVVEYYQVSGCCPSPDNVTFEVIMYNDGSMLFQYQDIFFNDGGYRDYGASATIGIQGDAQTGLQYSFESPVLADGMAICFAYPGAAPNCQSVDIPWLSEDPISGTVDADSVFDIDVTLDSMTYTVGDSVSAMLKIKTDDNNFSIPVTMNVVAPSAPVVSFTSDSPVLVGTPMHFTNTSDPGNPPTTEFLWDFGDGTTLTTPSATPVSHIYLSFGTFPVTLSACNVMGCDTFTTEVTVTALKFFMPMIAKP